MPTPLGPIVLDWQDTGRFTLSLSLPEGMKARVELPARGRSGTVTVNGEPAAATRDGRYWVLAQEVTGEVTLAVE